MTRLADAASPEDVEEAIRALTKEQLLGLRRYAESLLSPAGGLLRGNGVDDLMNEAMSRALSGARGWPPGRVDFVGFLRQAMHSISSGWYERGDSSEAAEASLGAAGSGSLESLRSAKQPPLQERQALAREALTRIKQSLAEDPMAVDVLEGLEAGYSGPEIKELLDISETELQTTKRRISRLVRRLHAEPVGKSG